MAFFTVSDAQAIQFDVPARRLGWSGRRVARVSAARPRPAQPAAAGAQCRRDGGDPGAGAPQVSAVMVSLPAGLAAGSVMDTFAAWTDVTVYTRRSRLNLLLSGMVDKARRQLGCSVRCW
jgi:hypothetical protein